MNVTSKGGHSRDVRSCHAPNFQTIWTLRQLGTHAAVISWGFSFEAMPFNWPSTGGLPTPTPWMTSEVSP